ncbi:PQQ-binding-like beta-propeller repeat protein [Streptomyces sp. NPDC046985]|uniref:outer membrane protein assembly factor BamB family protein n=1 Tax=Streptomyces sp. NPDC046985 TaxID=3155377 RepID=UPI0033D7CF0E
MTQPPPPHEPPQQGGFGPPQDGAPQDGKPPQPPHAPQAPPASGGPDLAKPAQPAPGYGYPQAPPPPQGAPQTPPPPGPPQPGYGYPQAAQAPQPPQAPPGYGYPGQPQPAAPAPNPYAQAPQPGPYGAPQPGQPGYGYPAAPGQPGYGYPAQPGYGYPGQPPTAPTHPQAGQPGGSTARRKQLTIVAAAVVAIALIVGGGVWYAHSGHGGGTKGAATAGGRAGGKKGRTAGAGGASAAGTEKAPADPAAKVLFQVPAPAVKDDQVDSVQGSWLTGTVYAKSGIDKVVGYDPDTGAAKWTLPLSGQTCAASRQMTADGVAAVLTEEKPRNAKGDHQPCDQITAFEVATGRKLWTESAASGDAKAAFGEVSISGGTVAAGGGFNGGAAFDVKTGKALWQPKTGACEDVGYAGGAQLVAVRKCGDYGNERYQVQLLNPANGAVKWSYKLPAGIDNAKVISTEPVVFGADSGGITASGATDVFSLDDGGRLLYKISLPDGKYAHRCEVGKTDGCQGIAVGNGKLYVPTEEHDGSAAYSRTNEIVAFSLRTGKSTGDRIDAGDGYTIFPVRMDGGDVIAYKDGPYDKGAQIVSVDGATTRQTKLLETPADQSVLSAISSMVPDRAELLYADGRLFLGKSLLGKAISAGEKRYTSIGFGAK